MTLDLLGEVFAGKKLYQKVTHRIFRRPRRVTVFEAELTFFSDYVDRLSAFDLAEIDRWERVGEPIVGNGKLPELFCLIGNPRDSLSSQ